MCFGSPIGAAHRYWDASWGYTWVFGFPTGSTRGCLDSQTGDPASCQALPSSIRPPCAVAEHFLAVRIAKEEEAEERLRQEQVAAENKATSDMKPACYG